MIYAGKGRMFFDFWTSDVGEQAGVLEKHGGGNPLVSGLEYDSRGVKKDSLYFALPGLHTDGHNFIDDGIVNGASVIVHQNALDVYKKNILYIRVKDSRFAMSIISAAFYNHPSKHLCIIGVTGTEGKSSTVYFIFQLLRLAGKKAGFISTVQYSVSGEARWNTEHQTTPEATTINMRLAEMIENGVEYAVLESSSHGLSVKTNRLGNIDFDVAVMTNVTHEHLEFHGTWEQYRNDKANLFRALDLARHNKIINNSMIDVPSFAVVNACDPSAEYFSNATLKPVYSFGKKMGDADLCTQHIVSGAGGNSYEIVKRRTCEKYLVHDNLPGEFNAGNVLASLIVVSNLTGISVKDICSFIPKLMPVRGRMTTIDKGQNFEVIVDYAHTPSSFETIFPPLRKRADEKGGRIISVFGSPGERDTRKRAGQGRIASEWSDIVVLTDEDPRGEDPMTILEEIAAAAVNKIRNKDLFLIPDRPLAIRKAFSLAAPGDIVLLLGKGHENSIIYSRGGKKTIAYDEIAEAEKALANSEFYHFAG
jgi:UDP-N-acetylmuramoyl-L-alanyl-D-glutamate--2,6-diaminopimelate ligase